MADAEKITTADAGSSAIAVRGDDGNGVRSSAVDRGAVSETAAILSLIERAARDPNVDVDKMERLFAMQQQAAERRASVEFYAAFADLQRDIPAVARRGKSNNGKFARFEDIVETIKPKLAQHGFSLAFRVESAPTTVKVTGVLGHASGHTERTDIVLPADKSGSKNEVQAWGSSVSYGKRYVATTLLGIATENEDDDGKAAGAKAPAEHTVAALKAKIAETKADAGWICEHYSVETLDDLTGKQIAAAMAGLSARKRQQVTK